jgi:hypothetical protein
VNDIVERLRCDAEKARSNYPEVFCVSEDLADEAAAEIERLRLGCTMLNSEVCQRLGKALGYPWFKDDQENFPGATEDSGVCTGDHVAETIAAEAARQIGNLEAERDAARMDADMLDREVGNMEHNARVLLAERDRLRNLLAWAEVKLSEGRLYIGYGNAGPLHDQITENIIQRARAALGETRA